MNRRPTVTKVLVPIGVISGDITVGVYANNGQTGRNAAAGEAYAKTGAIAVSSLLNEAGSPIATIELAVIPLGATIPLVNVGDWMSISSNNNTLTLGRPQANPTNSLILKGLQAVQAVNPVSQTAASAFVSTPMIFAMVE